MIIIKEFHRKEQDTVVELAHAAVDDEKEDVHFFIYLLKHTHK